VSSWVNLQALWQILVVGLLAGAGLPALFAVGLRALSMPGHRVQPATAGASPGAGASPAAGARHAAVADDDSDSIVGGSRLGLVIATICFVIVLGAIGWGLYLIVISSR
jgi:hypothetical protein